MYRSRASREGGVLCWCEEELERNEGGPSRRLWTSVHQSSRCRLIDYRLRLRMFNLPLFCERAVCICLPSTIVSFTAVVKQTVVSPHYTRFVSHVCLKSVPFPFSLGAFWAEYILHSTVPECSTTPHLRPLCPVSSGRAGSRAAGHGRRPR